MPGNSPAGAANLGLVRPPIVYLVAIVLGLIIHSFWPRHVISPPLGIPIGILVTAFAVWLFVSAVRTFKAAGTAVPGHQPTTAIVRTGPYRLSRNPIYLAFTLFQLGLAILVNSAAVLLTLIPAVLLMALIVIPREERYLTERFPDEYAPYRKQVRRWM